ncbi:MAG TPA: hypothetical protein VKW04_24910 [Planctomycetota bacterium]|nr:hypothetical protein [Planctomycetota bacterium]
MTATDAFAAYGAFVSTCVALRQWFVEGTRVGVDVYLAKLSNGVLVPSGGHVGGGEPDHWLQRFIAVRVTNHGRSPIVVKGVYGAQLDGQRLLFSDAPGSRMPQTIPPNDNTQILVELPAPGKDILKLNLSSLYVIDGVGKKRTARLKILRAQYDAWMKSKEKDPEHP